MEAIKKPECILEAMEIISYKATRSHLSDEFFESVEIYTDYLAERLQITRIQAVLFSLLMNHCEDDCIHLGDIGDLTGCPPTRILRFSKSLEELAERFYIRIIKTHSFDAYRIPREVVISLRDDEPYRLKPTEISDVNEFFDEYRQILRERKLEEITHDMLRILTEEMLGQIKDTHFVETLYRELADADDRLHFIHMASIYISYMDDYIGFQKMAEIYDDKEMPVLLKKRFRSNNSVLQARLIENSNNDGMAIPDSYRLTDYAKNDVLSEISMKRSTHTSHNLTRHESLSEKTLIYNEREGEQIEQLTSLLMPERFSDIQECLEKSGMRRGFCCLFYGVPGTGKTETVYQIARKTGRDILRVNVNEIKSCWVGESEKNISNLFDRYRNICKESELAPILLFNEADAILGLRMEGAIRGVDKMENSLQNIILQEMETIDGIMIATTNLTSNLDRAFERRFLYKIKFEKPSVEARASIWMQMLNGLSPLDAAHLASRFDLSGGEIENIVRKHSVSTILSGSSILDINALCKICEQERVEYSRLRRIGF